MTAAPPPKLRSLQSESHFKSQFFEPPKTHAKAACIAKWAIAFFILSLVAIPLLTHYKATSYLPISYATAGTSFVIFIIANYCRTTCRKNCTRGLPPPETRATSPSTEEKNSPGGPLRGWLDEPVTPKLSTLLSINNRSSYLNLVPIVVLKEGSDKELSTIKKDGDSLKPLIDALHQEFTVDEGLHTNLLAYLKEASEHDTRFDRAKYIKKALWAICTQENNSLSSLGKTLLSSAPRQIFIERPLTSEEVELEAGLYCMVRKERTNLSLNQGELASLIMEVREKIASLSTPAAPAEEDRATRLKAQSAIAQAGNLKRLEQE